MALDKNDLSKLLTKIPKLVAKDLPSLEKRIEHVDTQIDQIKGLLYRNYTDTEVAKNFASKDDPDAPQVAETKLRTIAAEVKGYLWTLQAMRSLRADLEAEKPAKAAKK